MFRTTLLLAAFLLLAGCGKQWGTLQRLDLTVPGPTAIELDTARAFTAGAGQFQWFDRYFNGDDIGVTSQTLVARGGERFDTIGARGTRVEWLVSAAEGVRIDRSGNTAWKSVVVPEGGPFRYLPPRMAQGEAHRHEQRVSHRSERQTTRTVTIEHDSTFAGLEDVKLPFATLVDCPRVNTSVRVELPYFLSATISVRQWFHREYGEVLRDIDGDVKVVGLGVRGFTSRWVLRETRQARPEELTAFEAQSERAPKERFSGKEERN